MNKPSRRGGVGEPVLYKTRGFAGKVTAWEPPLQAMRSNGLNRYKCARIWEVNESIETFTGFIDAKDPYTNGHSKRVASYTRLIAEQFGYEGEALDRIYYVALLHDCGKIGVPDSILRKPGKLTDEEFEIIKSHTVRGGEILSAF